MFEMTDNNVYNKHSLNAIIAHVCISNDVRGGNLQHYKLCNEYMSEQRQGARTNFIVDGNTPGSRSNVLRGMRAPAGEIMK